MPHEYWCAACEALSAERHERRADAEDELVEHRRTTHGGLRPARGDGVRRVHAEARGDGCLPAGSFWAALFLLALVLANCWGR
ncbi:hypothetical protein ACJWDR_37590 [Streptomyces tauricus]|uniref:hypothetical protein n=1 Tax=Streptomyces tauricus TaxID=68274 RepID=UPI00387F031C